MKRHSADLRTALLCVSFILAAGVGTLLFTSPQAKPLVAIRGTQEGLEIFALSQAPGQEP